MGKLWDYLGAIFIIVVYDPVACEVYAKEKDMS